MVSYNIVKSGCLVLLFSIVLSNKSVEAAPNYTREEEKAIVKDYMKSDAYLIRWLRARNFNQDDAVVMLRKAMKWRMDNKIDGILDEVIYERVRPFYADGIDNEGSVVATAHASRFDTRSFIVAGKRSVLIRYWSQLCEMIEQTIMKNLGVIGNNTLEGNATDRVIVIENLHGYNLRQHACLACFGIFENYYTGFAKKLFFINTPRIFIPMLELLKPLMSLQTRNGLRVYGTNKAEWQMAIIGKIVRPDQVRAAFGGTKPE